MSNKFNEVQIIGTDGASLFFYPPDDLAHRLRDLTNWVDYHFAIQKYFKAGNLIGIFKCLQ